MKNLKSSLPGVALLSTACVFVVTRGSSVGLPVNDSLAVSIRGGACDNNFSYDNESPVYCPGREVGCSTSIPNSVGRGTTGSKESSCGAAVGCGTFTGPDDCAQVSTAIAANLEP